MIAGLRARGRRERIAAQIWGEEKSGTPPGMAVVWYANPRNVTEDDLAAFDRILSPAERETLSRYHRWDDQREYGLAHALLRLQLGDHLELPPGELRIERTQWDKPYLAGPVSPVELDFSISHAHDCVASGICDSGGIGIDVESCDRDPGIDSIAGLCLTAGEQRSLQRSSSRCAEKSVHDHLDAQGSLSEGHRQRLFNTPDRSGIRH